MSTLYASGYSADEIYEIFKKYSRKIKYIDSRNIYKLVYGVLLKRKIIINGLNSGEIIERIINEECSKKNINYINQIKMPLLIPSVSLNDGTIYIFSSKEIRKTFSNKIKYVYNINIGKAVRASCSYPGVFSPCKYNNIELIDGGIRENVPWKETKKLGANKVLSIVFENEINEKCCKNIIEVASRSIEILCHELSTYELDGADYLLKIKSKNVSLLDIEKIDELYNQGYRETKKQIINIKSKLNI